MKVAIATKLILGSIFTVISITSCSQPYKENSILNQIKRDTTANEYNIQYESSFPIEILVNDVPVVRHVKYLGVERTVHINWAIARSGKQQLSYTVDLSSYDTRANVVKKQPVVKIALYSICCNESLFDIPEDAISYTLPIEKLTEADIQNGFFTDTISFESYVAYDFSSWKNGEVLSTKDAQQLKKNLYEAYREIVESLEEEDQDSLHAQWGNAQYENGVSLNWEKKWALEEQEGIYSIVPTIPLLDSCELKIYGNGQLATLVVMDKGVIPHSAMTSLMYNEVFGRNYIQYHNLYFYIPKGTNTFKLIRYDFYSFS